MTRPLGKESEIAPTNAANSTYDAANDHFIMGAFEGGRLQAIAVNPDGRPYAYRIIDPRKFVLSVRFDL